MKNGRAVHIGDYKIVRDATRKCLPEFSDRRHEVVGEAADLARAIAVLDKVDELNANVVFLGNLTSATADEDVKAITDHIKEAKIPVKVIGLGTVAMESVDVNVTKDEIMEKGVDTLVKAIDGLEEVPR